LSYKQNDLEIQEVFSLFPALFIRMSPQVSTFLCKKHILLEFKLQYWKKEKKTIFPKIWWPIYKLHLKVQTKVVCFSFITCGVNQAF